MTTWNVQPTSAGTFAATQGADDTFPLTDDVSAAGYAITNLKLSDLYQLNENVTVMPKYDNFASAVSAIGSAAHTLLITTNQAVEIDVTVPSTLTLWFMGDGKLTVSAGKTVTINGPVTADIRQIFAGAGTVTGLKETYPEWWGINTTPGTTDMTSAIQAASTAAVPGGTVHFQNVIYLVTSMITMSAYQTWKGAGRYSTFIQKGFNGDLIQAGSISRITDMSFDGDGGTYTGRGILYTAADPLCVIDNCRIVDFNGYCVEFTVDNAGTQYTMRDCEVYRTTLTDPAIKLPNDGSIATPRMFFGIETSGGVLIDLGGCQNVILQGCFMHNVTFSDNSKKCALVGNRIATVGGTLEIKGQEHTVVGNIIAGNLELMTNCNRCVVQSNIVAEGFTIADSSGSIGSSANTIDIPWTTYTPTWTGDVSNPVLGNGSLAGFYKVEGKRVFVSIELTIGSSTTFGSGAWRFALPFSTNMSMNVIGVAKFLDSGTAHYAGSSLIETGTSTVLTYANNATDSSRSTIPYTWADGDKLLVQIDYERV